VSSLIAAAGAAGVLFGVLYGEMFGPTKLLPVLWLAPLDSPTRLLATAIIAGAVLLTAGYGIGIVNRRREGGVLLALTDASGVPGLVLLAAAGLVTLGVMLPAAGLTIGGLVGVAVALLALAVGLRAEASSGATAVLEVLIGLFDAVVRLFSNLFSFARLAAFGLMHAALGQVVLHAAGGLLGSPVGDLAGAVLFLGGSSIAFALEGLVVSVQALRLEYYELFSRLFTRDGRPFHAWSLPLLASEEAR
jgi:V/A-type H+-transporting ATPase subunit I